MWLSAVEGWGMVRLPKSEDPAAACGARKRGFFRKNGWNVKVWLDRGEKVLRLDETRLDDQVRRR
jgi:hypothetical protein